MGQSQSSLRISSEKPKKEKRKTTRRGKFLGRCLCSFSILSCVGGPPRNCASSSNDDTDSESSLSVDGCVTHHLAKEHKENTNQRKLKKHKLKTVKRGFSWWSKNLNNTPPTVMEKEEEQVLPLSGPLVRYMLVWRPAPSPRPAHWMTPAGKLLLSELASLETLTFFMAPVWPKLPKVFLTLAGRMAIEDTTPSRGQLEAEKEASLSEENPERVHSERVYEEDLPLVDLWNASDFHWTRRLAGRLQTLEEICQLIQVIMDNRTQLWWRKQLHIDLLNPEGSVAVSTTDLEVTGVQLLGGRKISHIMSHHINTRREFSYFEDGQEVDIMTSFEGFVKAGGETQTTSWTLSTKESTFSDPPPGSYTSPPSPPFEEDLEDDVEAPKVQVPQMQRYFAYKGISDFEYKVKALRKAFQDLTNTSQSLNLISHAGRMVLGGLAELNNQDVRDFQRAYDRLISHINEPENREAIMEEIGQSGITQINFLDLFFEMVLLGLLEGKTVYAAPRPNGFLHVLYGVILAIQPPGQSWSQEAQSFLSSIKSQMLSWMDAIFDLEDHLYDCSENLSGEVLENLEMQVEYLLSYLD